MVAMVKGNHIALVRMQETRTGQHLNEIIWLVHSTGTIAVHPAMRVQLLWQVRGAEEAVASPGTIMHCLCGPRGSPAALPFLAVRAKVEPGGPSFAGPCLWAQA